jgi:hypothetical protein
VARHVGSLPGLCGACEPRCGVAAECVRVRDIDDDEGWRLPRIVRRGSGSGGEIARGHLHRRRPGQGVIHFGHGWFRFAVPAIQRRAPEDVRSARTSGDQEDRQVDPTEQRPGILSAWIRSKLADLLVTRGAVDDIQRGLRFCSEGRDGVSLHKVRHRGRPTDPDYAVKKRPPPGRRRAITDREVVPEPNEPEVVFCLGSDHAKPSRVVDRDDVEALYYVGLLHYSCFRTSLPVRHGQPPVQADTAHLHCVRIQCATGATPQSWPEFDGRLSTPPPRPEDRPWCAGPASHQRSQ